MNETNHHKVIKKFALSELPVFSKDVLTLENASNFTDDFMGASKVGADIGSESKYFFYHFYYDIECDSRSGTIKLLRNHHDVDGKGYTFNQCDLGQKKNDFETTKSTLAADDYAPVQIETVPNYKKFFTYINDREDYSFSPYLREDDKFDNSNQSDCVAFLHAMAAEGGNEKDAQKIFEDHLRNCFAEFLFLGKKKHDEAIFMLGIAFHGIMDSFTPSHMGFQQYTQQNMALHAQGDVLLFENDKVEFDPGQFKEESLIGKAAFAIAKGYNSNENINEIEFKMFKIFVDIFDFDQDDPDIKALLADDTRFKYIQHYPDGYSKTVRSKMLFNDIIRKKTCGSHSLIYAEKAIQTIKEIYKLLIARRLNSYDDYKKYVLNTNEKLEDTINGVVKVWRDIYDGEEITEVRNNHLEKKFYAKK